MNSILTPGLLEKAVACGLRSLFVGFETNNAANLREQRKFQNLRRDYGAMPNTKLPFTMTPRSCRRRMAPAGLSPTALEEGYWRSYTNFYRWGSILRGAWSKEGSVARLRHFAYAAGWKKFEFLWNFVIRTKRVASMLPVLESVLENFGKLPSERPGTATLRPATSSIEARVHSS